MGGPGAKAGTANRTVWVMLAIAVVLPSAVGKGVGGVSHVLHAYFDSP